MKYLVDTNVLSEPRKGPERANASVARWIARTPSDDIAFSVITILETARGIALMRRRDPLQANQIQRWWDRTLEELRGQILNVDTRVALAAAQLHVPNPRPHLDALIAATAQVHGLTVVTRNVKDFEPMGVPIINPWEL